MDSSKTKSVSLMAYLLLGGAVFTLSVPAQALVVYPGRLERPNSQVEEACQINILYLRATAHPELFQRNLIQATHIQRTARVLFSHSNQSELPFDTDSPGNPETGFYDYLLAARAQEMLTIIFDSTFGHPIRAIYHQIINNQPTHELICHLDETLNDEEENEDLEFLVEDGSDSDLAE